MTKRRNVVSKPKASRKSPASREDCKQHLDERLDEALEETFPASDPVALTPRRGNATRAPRE